MGALINVLVHVCLETNMDETFAFFDNSHCVCAPCVANEPRAQCRPPIQYTHAEREWWILFYGSLTRFVAVVHVHAVVIVVVVVGFTPCIIPGPTDTQALWLFRIL